MLDNIIQFYKTKVTSYSLVFRHMKIIYFLVRLIILNFFLSVFLLLTNVISLFVNLDRFIPFFYYFMTSLLLFVIIMFKFNMKAKQILLNKYRIQSNQKNWRTKEFEDLRIKMMSDYLQRNNLYTDKKIIFLREMLIKKLNDKKIPSLIAPGILLVFIGPVWVEFLKYTFQHNVNSYNGAIQSFVGISVAVALVIVLINIGSSIYSEIKEIFSRNDSSVIKYLVNFLEDIQLIMPESGSEK